jgi:hypothetical protein
MLSEEQKIKKSKPVAIVLAAVLGPIGLIYASYVGATVMFFVPLLLSFLWYSDLLFDYQVQSYSFVFATFIIASTWSGCVIWAIKGVTKHNNEIDVQKGNQ